MGDGGLSDHLLDNKIHDQSIVFEFDVMIHDLMMDLKRRFLKGKERNTTLRIYRLEFPAWMFFLFGFVDDTSGCCAS